MRIHFDSDGLPAHTPIWDDGHRTMVVGAEREIIHFTLRLQSKLNTAESAVPQNDLPIMYIYGFFVWASTENTRLYLLAYFGLS